MKRLAIGSLILAICVTNAASPTPCSSPEHRQFDFWIGEWQVHKPDGTLAGINRISREYGGCVIHERYAAAKGYNGESLNIFDAGRKVWHQTWVDVDGLLLTLEGRWDGKNMVLEGMKQRVTWTPDAEGGVRQLWEASDGKGGWTVVFDGRYTKK